jgi:hypothetical protein
MSDRKGVGLHQRASSLARLHDGNCDEEAMLIRVFGCRASSWGGL